MANPTYSVLVAGLVHETHTFLAQQTEQSGFQDLIWVRDQALFERCRADASPMGGALEIADRNDWKITASRYGVAMPSGTVSDEVLEIWWREVAADIDSMVTDNGPGIDGVLLILHGAMVFASHPDGEGELLRRIRLHLRRWLGAERADAIPIAADLDLHANFSHAMAEYGSVFTAYRENPHTDARTAGTRAAQFLQRLMESRQRTQVVTVHPPLIYGPKGTASAADPVRTLEAMARQLEAVHPELLEVCVLPGFSYADVPFAGVSFCATTIADVEDARKLLQPLAGEALARAAEGNPLDPPVDEVMPQALKHTSGPIGIIEPSDNIGGGTPGDGTGVLSAFLRFEVDNAAVILNDREIAAACHSRSPQDLMTLTMGGKVDKHHGDSVTLEVRLESLSDGCFELENEYSHLASLVGRSVDMGPSAVVRHKGLQILLTTHKTPPMDLGQLRSQSIVPEDLYMIGIKAAIAHRAAYDPILRASYYVDTPGMGSSDLRRFPYRNLSRPIRPLD
ncbi:MAG: M81 family metallopeptidase [Candidatus Latescibacterota bacterium]|nr:M81 family metallopeptidase [Candidatus Latescibacterota bacterium]